MREYKWFYWKPLDNHKTGFSKFITLAILKREFWGFMIRLRDGVYIKIGFLYFEISEFPF